MALPKRNRRSIIVDEVVYHVSFGMKYDRRRCTATVQHGAGTGAKLIIDPVGEFLPSVTAEAIKFAVLNGWNPETSGPEFWIGYNSNSEHSTKFCLRSATDPPYWKEC